MTLTEKTTTPAAPAVVSAAALQTSIRIEPLTCTIGAELSNVDLGAASRDTSLVAEIRALLLKHKVLFLRDQDFTRAEHVAFARHFGDLEDHPVAGSDPEHPGLVRIYKDPDSKKEHYENAWHCDATWREKPPFGCVLRCIETPEVGGDTICVQHGRWPTSACPSPSRRRLPTCAPGTASRPPSGPPCRSRSASP